MIIVPSFLYVLEVLSLKCFQCNYKPSFWCWVRELFCLFETENGGCQRRQGDKWAWNVVRLLQMALIRVRFQVED